MPPTEMRWLSPAGLRADQNGIEWNLAESFKRGGYVVPEPRLLDDFVQLTNASSSEIIDFASVHGVLGHAVDRPPSAFGRGYMRETVREWHEAASLARALLVAAEKLRQGQLLNDEMRCTLLRTAHVAFHDDADADDELVFQRGYPALTEDRMALTLAVTQWMHDRDAQLILTWPAGATEPSLTIGGQRQYGCLAAITVQVALACSRADTARSCDGCGVLHAPSRQPKPGQRSFCKSCRAALVPQKYANRDRRARERTTRQSNQGEGSVTP